MFLQNIKCYPIIKLSDQNENCKISESFFQIKSDAENFKKNNRLLKYVFLKSLTLKVDLNNRSFNLNVSLLQM